MRPFFVINNARNNLSGKMIQAVFTAAGDFIFPAAFQFQRPDRTEKTAPKVNMACRSLEDEKEPAPMKKQYFFMASYR